ncbi:MAG: hypothetical protein ABI663_17235 [Chryseolinea sp.]
MSESISERINIFLTVDTQTINEYFNMHDPAPIYKRQLSHQLQDYIMACSRPAKRYSVIFYKMKCTSEIDKEYAKPLMYSIRRHFSLKKIIREKEFEKFKIRSWTLLGISLLVAMFCQGIVPLLIDTENPVWRPLNSSLDIFSWVLLWRPIDVLLFSWTPHLKDISLLDKLATSELIIIENER